MRIFGKVVVTGDRVTFDLEHLPMSPSTKELTRRMCKEFIEDLYADSCIIWFEDEPEPK